MLTVLWDQPSPGLPWIAVLCGSLVAAVWDVRTRRIPNWLTGLMIFAGIVWDAWYCSWVGVGDGLLGCLLLASPFVFLFLLGGGAGDAKLMGAIGVWLGVRNGIVALLCVVIAGALIGVIYAASKRRGGHVLMNLWSMVLGLLGMIRGQHQWNRPQDVMPGPDSMLKMPYGLSIFVGVCVAGAGVFAWRTGYFS